MTDDSRRLTVVTDWLRSFAKEAYQHGSGWSLTTWYEVKARELLALLEAPKPARLDEVVQSTPIFNHHGKEIGRRTDEPPFPSAVPSEEEK